jgi:2,4-dienoyl-CoA reductase-like NADH-dependent reductase (Old Yellow Enzyme family)
MSLSGAGLMVLEATAVEARGRISLQCLGLWNDAQEEAFARLLAEIRENSDIRIGLQLGHAGRKGSRAMTTPRGSRALTAEEGGWQGVAPSALAYDDGWVRPLELDLEGMADLRKAFADAARRADRAGFDLVELHAAHGYLLHAFRAPISNRRTDAYGGTATNRERFPLEVVEAMRRALSPRKPLGVRINGADWHEGGVSLEETIGFARRLKEVGADYVTTSGGASAPHISPPPVTPGYMVDFAEAVRHGADITTTAVGMIVTARQAEAILTDCRADMVAIGRGFLDDPRWGWHAAAELGEQAVYPPQYEKAHPRAWRAYQVVHEGP